MGDKVETLKAYLVTGISEHGNQKREFLVIDTSPKEAREAVLQTRSADGGIQSCKTLDLNKKSLFVLG